MNKAINQELEQIHEERSSKNSMQNLKVASNHHLNTTNKPASIASQIFNLAKICNGEAYCTGGQEGKHRLQKNNKRYKYSLAHHTKQ